MTCYAPLKCFRGDKTKTGKREIVFREELARTPEKLELKCGQCIGCRLDNSLSWAVRCIHQAQTMTEENRQSFFLTLTYNDENLPPDGSCNYEHVKKFIKRLRKAGHEFTYVAVQEYGALLSRPHYHLMIFGWEPDDITMIGKSNGEDLFTSDYLQKKWNKGFISIGECTVETAAYLARYCLKKINGKNKDEHYVRDDPLTGIVHRLEPEKICASNGLGKAWIQKYWRDVYPDSRILAWKGEVLKAYSVPRYYDNEYEKIDPEALEEVKLARKKRALANIHNRPDRLEVRHQCQKLRNKKLSRSYEQHENQDFHGL